MEGGGDDEGTSKGLKYAEGGEELGLMVEANCTRGRVGMRATSSRDVSRPRARARGVSSRPCGVLGHTSPPALTSADYSGLACVTVMLFRMMEA